MMNTTSNTFARRARLSTTSIALAIALTAAAVAAVLYSNGTTELGGYKLDSPIRSQTAPAS
ncbi:MAG: hypothetical protein JNL45_11630 [Hyphomicrobium sp.]|nr:hypothetical protein [Hyphomicrobium sp.]